MKPESLRLIGILMAVPVLVAGAVFWHEKAEALAREDYPNPYGSPQTFMEGIYAADHRAEPPGTHRVRAVIVPHHLTAAESIAAGIRLLQKSKVSKILLLSPDHFQACPALLCTTYGRFKTLFGDVSVSADGVRTLLNSPLAENMPGLFRKEHGIYAILPFIRHYFPKAAVIPVVLSTQLSWMAARGQLLSALEPLMDDQTALVVSSDFSHYLPLDKANAMDEKTVKTLFSKNLEGLARLSNPGQSDCPGCLWLLGSLADQGKFYNPSILLHTNSAVILGDPKNPSTTSHFSMAWYAD